MSLKEAMKAKNATEWARAYDAELDRHGTSLKTWTYEKARPDYHSMSHIMNFKAKNNIYRGLEKHKMGCAIRGNRMKKRMDFDKTRTASQIPSQSGRKQLIASAAAQGYEVQSWDIPGAFIRAPSDPRFRVIMTQPPLANGTYKETGKIYVIRRAMKGDPASNAQWDCWRDYWFQQ